MDCQCNKQHADERGSRRAPSPFWHHICASISRPVCVRVWVCVFVHKYTCDQLNVASSIVNPLYNRNYSSNRNSPFNLVHLSRRLSLMSDCTKKGQGGLGSGGWNKQLGFALSFSLLLSHALVLFLSARFQGLIWHTVTVSLLAIKANLNVQVF